MFSQMTPFVLQVQNKVMLNKSTMNTSVELRQEKGKVKDRISEENVNG